jgi:hypothetical protein
MVLFTAVECFASRLYVLFDRRECGFVAYKLLQSACCSKDLIARESLMFVADGELQKKVVELKCCSP